MQGLDLTYFQIGLYKLMMVYYTYYTIDFGASPLSKDQSSCFMATVLTALVITSGPYTSFMWVLWRPLHLPKRVKMQ